MRRLDGIFFAWHCRQNPAMHKALPEPTNKAKQKKCSPSHPQRDSEEVY